MVKIDHVLVSDIIERFIKKKKKKKVSFFIVTDIYFFTTALKSICTASYLGNFTLQYFIVQNVVKYQYGISTILFSSRIAFYILPKNVLK